MEISSQDIEQRVARLEQECRKTGAKLTHQRLEIFREIVQSKDHPDAESVFRRMRKRMPTLSKDTVYRTLWWLKDMGHITVLGPPRESTRFDANLDHHHHFICTRCGQTADFHSEEFDKLNLPDSLLTIGNVEQIQVEVKGICINCADGNSRAK